MTLEDRIKLLEAQVAYLMGNTRKISYETPFRPSDYGLDPSRFSSEPLKCTRSLETNRVT
jgi:hypothetical protein